MALLDVCSWHFSEVTAVMCEVRCWAKTGSDRQPPNRRVGPIADMAFWARSFIVPSADAMEVEDEVPADIRYA
jgi:hypothetical protein